MSASEGRLTGEGEGEVETEEGVLVLKRVHVVYRLRGEEADRATAERVHAVHHGACPVYRSLQAALEITTELDFQAE
jgi:uncharacterized OsmC-like protein